MKQLAVLCASFLGLSITIMTTAIGIGKAQSGNENMIQKTFPVGGEGTLFLDAAIGTVDVSTVTTNVVTVRVIPELKTDRAEERQRSLANLEVDITQQQNDVRVTAKFRRETPDDERRQVKLRFEISIPPNYNLDLNTVGRIAAGDLRGNVKIETAGGEINIGDVSGALTVDSSGGSVTVGRVGGPSKIVTSGGPVSFKEILDSVEADTGGGSFTAYVSQQPRSDSSVSTSGGGIELRLAQNVGVNLDAATTSGRVSTDDPSLTAPHSKLNALQANINGGGPRLVLRAAAGSIHLRTQPPPAKNGQQ
ncbi:MAG TPA: hypothetical protein VJT15_25530 [Pyrinomonadaceae bacterium]|nr:hypothetical protein [Pyrinomonadaceae bacterium]